MLTFVMWVLVWAALKTLLWNILHQPSTVLPLSVCSRKSECPCHACGDGPEVGGGVQHESGQHSPVTSHHHIPCPAGPWQGVTPCKPLPDRLGPWHGVSTCKPHHTLINHLLVLTALMGPAASCWWAAATWCHWRCSVCGKWALLSDAIIVLVSKHLVGVVFVWLFNIFGHLQEYLWTWV